MGGAHTAYATSLSGSSGELMAIIAPMIGLRPGDTNLFDAEADWVNSRRHAAWRLEFL